MVMHCGVGLASDEEAAFRLAKAALAQEYSSIRTLRVEYDYVSVQKPGSSQPKEKIGIENRWRAVRWLDGQKRRTDASPDDPGPQGPFNSVRTFDGSRSFIAYFKPTEEGQWQMRSLLILPDRLDDFSSSRDPVICYGIELPGIDGSLKAALDLVAPGDATLATRGGGRMLSVTWPALMHPRENMHYRVRVELDESIGWLPRMIRRVPEKSPNPKIGGPEEFQDVLENLEFSKVKDGLTGAERLYPTRSRFECQFMTLMLTVRQVSINEPIAAHEFTLRPQQGTEVSIRPDRPGAEAQSYVEGGVALTQPTIDRTVASVAAAGVRYDATPRARGWFRWLFWVCGTVLALVLVRGMVRIFRR